MTGPTPRQLEVLRAIQRSIAVRGFPPTLHELCERFRWASTNAAQWHVDRLIAKGLLEGDFNVARRLRVTEAGARAIGALPLGSCPVTTERRCPSCGAAFFGNGCPLCASEVDRTSGSVLACEAAKKADPSQRCSAVEGPYDTGDEVR